MSPPFLPPMRILRVPLAAGTVWLAIAWLAWARHLPGRKEATGLLADMHTAAAFLGIAGVLVFFALAAYFIGALWMAINATTRKLASDLSTRVLGDRRLAPWLAPSERYSIARAFPNWLSDPDRKFGRLLPKLGITRPERSQWSEDAQLEVFTAAAEDFAWFDAVVADEHPALWERHDRVWMEGLFADVLAFPLACGAVLLGWSIWPTWWGIGAGVLIGVLGWYVMKGAAATMEKAAWGVMLEAVYVGKFEAPRLTACALRHFGPLVELDERAPGPQVEERDAGDETDQAQASGRSSGTTTTVQADAQAQRGPRKTKSPGHT